jgi:hypothetical protein
MPVRISQWKSGIRIILKISTIKKRKMGRFSNKNFKIFNNITSIFVFIFGLIGSIAFWVFLSRGDVYDNWYPLVGHFVSAHGSFIGIIFWEYMRQTGKSFLDIVRDVIEFFKKVKKK